jgi:3-hydroxyisobutyrate dehydrogenase
VIAGRRGKDNEVHTTPSNKIGFVGIGAMGLPMALRLSEAGYDVRAVDPNPQQISRAESLGLSASTDQASLTDCATIIVLVAKGDQLLSLLEGPLFTDRSRVELAIVMSTVGVEDVRRFAHALLNTQIGVIDSPMTGGVVGAKAGQLTLFAAGGAIDVQGAADMLGNFGQIKQCGVNPGDGQAFKLVNQLLAATNLAVAAEALAFARALGLDGTRALELISSGAGGSWMLTDRGPRMLEAPESRPTRTHLNILAKDAELVRMSASSASFSAPMLESASQAYRAALASGLGERDDSSLIDIY